MHFSAYSLFALIGGLLAVLTAMRKPSGLSRYDSLYCCIMGLVGAAVGGKLLYLFLNIPLLVKVFSTVGFESALKALLEGGFVFYGGLFGSMIAIYLVSRTNKLDFYRALDYLAPSFGAFILAGRIGCYVSGCCYGKMIGDFRFPTQLTEASFGLTVCVMLLIREKRKASTSGQFLWFIGSYACFRFIIEFLRGDSERGFFWIFSTSQWISLMILIWVSVTVSHCRKKD